MFAKRKLKRQTDLMIEQTVQQQRAKKETYERLSKEGLPIPVSLFAEMNPKPTVGF